jgi:hypothetical protein
MGRSTSVRKCMSADRRTRLWRGWLAGEPVKEIAAALGQPYGTIQIHVYHRGGCAPAHQVRAARALSLPEREEISRRLCAERSLRQIAQTPKWAPPPSVVKWLDTVAKEPIEPTWLIGSLGRRWSSQALQTGQTSQVASGSAQDAGAHQRPSSTTLLRRSVECAGTFSVQRSRDGRKYGPRVGVDQGRARCWRTFPLQPPLATGLTPVAMLLLPRTANFLATNRR